MLYCVCNHSGVLGHAALLGNPIAQELIASLTLSKTNLASFSYIV